MISKEPTGRLAGEPLPDKRVWLALGFRPFFLAAAVFAVLSMLLFLLGYETGVWHYNHLDLSLWHAHEMFFGYTAAVIAGFLLTAVRNWTGMNTTTARGLFMLLLLWLAGRMFAMGTFVPKWLLAVVDLSFLPVLAVVIAVPILKSGSRRNYPVPLLLLVMAAGNALFYAELLNHFDGGVQLGLWIAMGAVLALLSIIAGRVVPFFTERGLPGVSSTRHVWIERLSLPSLLIWFAVSISLSNEVVVAGCALFAASVHAVRLYGWGNLKIWHEPMLWIIYVAYGWFVIGLLMMSFPVGEMQLYALHAFTVGVIGLFTLGMMARVALGHTGRAIRASRGMVVAFSFLLCAPAFRALLPMIMPSLLELAVLVAGICWIVAFSIFVRIYAPYLLRVRADGQPG